MNQTAASLEPESPLDAARAALHDLARARRRNRAAGVDVFEGFYQAYLTAFGCAAAVLLGSDAIGDAKADAAQAASLAVHAPAFIGMAVSVVLLVAIRSGGRGGPLVLPAADVRHVLLAPVPRRQALRPATIRQVRFSAFVGMVIGAGVATVAARRLPGGVAQWAPLGGAIGAGLGVLSAATGLIASGRRFRPWLATLIGLVLVAWSGFDIALDRVTSPMGLVGQLALSPLRFRPVAVSVVGLVVVLVPLAIAGIGGLSLEAAERRATLASQVRFALTLQDLRTVVLLRRQLTQEQARTKPWIALRGVPEGRSVVLRRDLRGLTRWPAVRIWRVTFLGAVAGASLVGAWDGTTPLLLVAALCLFLAALDATEPLAQDVDHPDLGQSVPSVAGEMRARHVPVPLLAMTMVGLIAWGTALLIGVAGVYPVDLGVTVGAVLILPAVLLSTVGAAVSIVMGPALGGDFMPAEVAGLKMVLRVLWSPALVLLGLTPMLAARSAAHHHLAPGAAGVSASFFPMMAGVFGVAWLRFREDLHAYLKPPTPAPR